MTHYIEIRGMAYSPPELTIRIGDEIIWINKDSMGHTATRKEPPEFDTGLIVKNASSDPIRFNNVESELVYFCLPHSFMNGKIIVLQN